MSDIKYWCRGCDETFTSAETANAHHDATGHHQHWRPRSVFVHLPEASLAPSGESGVPKHWKCEANRSHGPCNTWNIPEGVSCEACGADRLGYPTVSSPEKPEPECTECAASGYVVICAAHREKGPSLPTDEEVERLMADLVNWSASAAADFASDAQAAHAQKQITATEGALRKLFASLHRDLEEARKNYAMARQMAGYQVQWGEEMQARAESFRVAANAVGERNEELERRLATAERERDEARKDSECWCTVHWGRDRLCPTHGDGPKATVRIIAPPEEDRES